MITLSLLCVFIFIGLIKTIARKIIKSKNNKKSKSYIKNKTNNNSQKTTIKNNETKTRTKSLTLNTYIENNNGLLMSEEEFTKVYQLIRRTVTKNKIPVKNPVCITLGGQPGSGKSTLYGIAQQRFSNNIVELDCDAFRIHHPYYNEIKNIYGKNDVLKTNPFVFKTIDLLIDDLSNEKYHLIIESSLNSPNSALDNGRNLPPKGYKVELHIMATPKEISWQGTIDRYNYQLKHNGDTRAVSKEYHDLVIKNICNSLNTVKKSGLMSNIIIYNRKKQCLYNMNKHKNIDPCALLYNIIHSKNNEKS